MDESVMKVIAEKTLRDEFAMAALIGLLSRSGTAVMHNWDRRDYASMAYSYANAMLLEKQKETP